MSMSSDKNLPADPLDSTESLKAEVQRLQSELAFFRNKELAEQEFFDALPDAILIARNADQSLVRVNREALRLFSYESEGLLRQSIACLHPSEALDLIRSAFKQAFEQEGGIAENIPCRRQDGSIFYADIACSSIIYNGELCMAGIFRDGTHRLQARFHHQLWWDFVQQSLQSMAITDMQGRIVFTNRALQKLFDLVEGDKKSTELFSQFYQPENSSRFDKIILPALMLHGQWNGETPMRSAQGRNFPTLECCHLIRMPTGEATHIAFMVIENTERQQQTDQLKQSLEQAKTASRAKSDFLAFMSHELRIIVNNIIGATDQLNPISMDEQNREWLEMMNVSNKSLLSTVNDLLDFSKIENQRMELERRPFNLSQLCVDISKTFSLLTTTSKLCLATLIDPTVHTAVLGDPARLRQILNNLIANAIKFTNEGSVTLTVTSTACLNSKQSLRFEIRDTGVGIPCDRIGQLFEPFSQANPSQSRKYGGSGLGLYICRSLLALMGGTIQCHSEEGKGSSFVFEMDLEIQDDEVVTDLSEQLSQVQGCRILLIDDQNPIRQIHKTRLQAWGCVVEEAFHSEQALTILHDTNKKFDIVLCDHHMPRVDGFKLGQQLQQHSELSKLRRIYYSAMGVRGDFAAASLAGYDAYLTAPYSDEQMLELLASLRLQRPTKILTKYHAKGALVGSLRILLVENNSVNQKTIQKLVFQLGHSCDVTSSGIDGLDLSSKFNYDLILMDLQMPGLNGMETTQKLRQKEQSMTNEPMSINRRGRNKIAHIPVIALSANSQDMVRHDCLAAGMDDVLIKPVQLEALQKIFSFWGGGYVEGLKDRRRH